MYSRGFGDLPLGALSYDLFRIGDLGRNVLSFDLLRAGDLGRNDLSWSFLNRSLGCRSGLLLRRFGLGLLGTFSFCCTFLGGRVLQSLIL